MNEPTTQQRGWMPVKYECVITMPVSNSIDSGSITALGVAIERLEASGFIKVNDIKPKKDA